MTNVLKDLNPTLVFKYFEEISQVPRGSGDEKRISEFLVNFAKELNLEVVQDEHLNVIIRKPATAGYENCPGVILQGHMDMVCEKNKDVDHDFEKDPIDLRIVDDMIYANGTTLGADNGIAVAMSMAVLASNDLSHPALEVLVTSNEEAGMTGANGLDGSLLKGKYIINLDSEEEGFLLVSCAGGNRSYVTLPLTYKNIEDNKQAFMIEVKGLLGGHSGMDIVKQRANSNVTMGRILNLLDVDFDLVEVNGGSKNNAIPRECEAVVAVNKDQAETLKANVAKIEELLKNEFKTTDPGLEVVVKEATADKAITDECKAKAMLLLNFIPNGIQTVSKDIEGLVESSSNLGVVKTENDVMSFESAVRSSVATLRENLNNKTKMLCDTVNANFENTDGYPAWEYAKNSKLEELCVDVYEKSTGKKPVITALHAGLECGLLLDKMPRCEAISMGPDMFEVHTPNEHLSIPSVKNVYEFLLAVLKSMNQY
ncbi:MAG: aminoacyl-histidine dipeptidase [Terrisporobacter othiniensis]|uniref:aminoacyl-histidine dipeptidase n=1 Tax=Terrisporobacter petrolearius TaxID=1460447 RepID=UPI0022E1F3E7|nr:aminoacyl-histidine dipeptidase [Terrisporobacter petrolearius]MDU4861909.1 aminoacyl-histidine dipeptidase [Terrisporobacter othiniensis]MDU6995794.1 aminoacyl-histidine dipeptidase [Terrisporobacter othiniensis]